MNEATRNEVIHLWYGGASRRRMQHAHFRDVPHDVLLDPDDGGRSCPRDRREAVPQPQPATIRRIGRSNTFSSFMRAVKFGELILTSMPSSERTHRRC